MLLIVAVNVLAFSLIAAMDSKLGILCFKRLVELNLCMHAPTITIFGPCLLLPMIIFSPRVVLVGGIIPAIYISRAQVPLVCL